MEIVKIKTLDGEMDLNIHNEFETDVLKVDLEDTLDLTDLVNYD